MKKNILLAGAALLLAATLSFGQVLPPGAETDGATFKARYTNPTPGEIPIMVWRCFDDGRLNEPWFKMIAGSGCNIIMGDVRKADSIAKAFLLAEKTGLKVIMGVQQMHRDINTIDAVRRFRNEKSLVGYFIGDEPSAAQFAEIAKVRDEIYTMDTTRLVYTNLLPNVSPKQMGAPTFEDYLTRAMDLIRMPLISYDLYPIRRFGGKDTVCDEFYLDFEKVSACAKKYGVPFWAFALVFAHNFYPEPQLAHLRYQLFNALAYGAQGLEYWRFCYYYDPEMKPITAPVLEDGSTTAVYDRMAIVNAEVRSFTDVFLGCEVKSHGHLGKIPKGTYPLKTLPGPFRMIKCGKEGVFVSQIDNGGCHYVVITNHDPYRRQKLNLKWEGELHRVLGNGREEAAKQKPTLAPGGYLIYRY